MKRGFTLIEVLMWLVVVCIVAASLLPAISPAKRHQNQIKPIKWSQWSAPVTGPDGFVQFKTNLDTGEVSGQHVFINY